MESMRTNVQIWLSVLHGLKSMQLAYNSAN